MIVNRSLNKFRVILLSGASRRPFSGPRVAKAYPHMMPISINRWLLFCQFIFCCALWAFFLSEIVPKNQQLSPHRLVLKEDPLSQVSVPGEYQKWRFLFQEVPTDIGLSFFSIIEQDWVLVCPKMHLFWAAFDYLRTAPCRTPLCFGRLSQGACV